MPTNMTVRPYAAADETDLVALWNEAMWADPIDAHTWRTRFLLDPNFSTDLCLIAVVEAKMIGFMLGMALAGNESREGWIVGFGISTDHRRQGVARSLLAHVEATMAVRGISRLTVGPYIPSYITPGIDEAAYPEAVSFVASAGSQVIDRPLSMKVSLTGYRPLQAAVDQAETLRAEGIVIRRAKAGDIVPLVHFLQAQFPHWRGDEIGVMNDLFGHDPRLVTLHLAEDNGVIIGYAQSRAERFGPFGVDESYRGRGVGAALLATVLPAMRARGYHCAWFLWTSDRAARLYTTHGFEEVRRFTLMTKEIAV